ncbi:hypothetical protein [Homoserinibacter sp. GY 40078]|uniref:hypothetical protein n=1 Tax=Homoserinibacter sp. GY 40078 TaxID=2603275 RepID=UPI001650C6FA|nr:hypothetical protein [Homoserinibacter sp. GY 40078]
MGYVSQGNKTAAPGSYQDWGRVSAGTYKYQYNGSTSGGVFYGANGGWNINADNANIYW